jgi:putative DNA primase/helicase
MIVEIRGRGCQTVVPPSIHESGEQIEWEWEGEFGKTTLTELRRWVAKIAAAALLVRYWQRGHETRHALAGMLARSGWAQKDTAEFVSAVVQVAQPDNKEAQADVRNCYDRLVRGAEIFGRPKLTELLGEQGKLILREVAKWLDLETSSGLIVNEDGTARAIVANAITLLKTSPCWQDVLAYNELTLSPVKVKSTPWGEETGPWTDNDDTKLTEWFQRHNLFIDSSKKAGEAANSIALENSFHPVLNYLNSLAWDGVPRLDTWLSTYLSSPHNKYTCAVGKCWLISGVARMYKPGCKVDHVLLLEGPQGFMKSMALNVLASDEFFLDDFADIHDKDGKLKFHRAWIVEMAELVGARHSAIDTLKAFLTCKDDIFRAPYDRRPQSHPRTNIFAATTNNATPFADETGNRRFWPVACGKIEIEKLRADRDQLWAEAVARFKGGEHWWFDAPELNKLADEEQAKRYQSGHLDEIIEAFLGNPTQRRDFAGAAVTPWRSTRDYVSIEDIRIHALDKTLDRWTQAEMNSVARCLIHNGWVRFEKRVGKLKKYFYRRPVSARGKG